jgi:hypothetical protein
VPRGNHPEYIVRIDVHIEVVDLLRRVGRSHWNGKQIQSDEGKSPLVTATIRPDESPLTESMSAWYAKLTVSPVIVLVPVPPPRM